MNDSLRIRWILCWLMFLATALSFLDRQVLSVLAPRLMVELDMTNTTYSRVVSAFVFSYTIMFAAAGWLIDRLGTRWGMVLCIGVWSLASAEHGLVVSAFGLGLTRLALGLGEGGCFPAATKVACELFPPEKRGLAIGIANGGSAFGAVLAPPLTMWLARYFGWRGAFFATGLAGFVWLLGWLAVPRSQPRTASASHVPPVAWRQLFGDARLWRILGARFLFDPVFYFYMFWIPQYLSRERGFSLDDIGNYVWIPFLALGISNLAAGQVSDLLVRRGWTPRQARTRLLLLAALMTPASGLVVLAPSAGWAIALMACLMLAHGLWICNFLAHISDQYPSSVIATVVGLSGTVGGSAGMLANLIVGPVVDHYSFTPAFVTSAVLYPLAFLVLWVGTTASREVGGKSAG
jgi:ACS family hexuronate transporter-like MFS transporter